LSKGDNFMLALAQWFSETQASLAIQEHDWLIPLLQTIHILAIAMVLSSVFMIDLRILRVTKSQSMAATAHRFVPWIWAGIALLAASGMILIVGEPQRSLPNRAFQIKMLLLAIAIATTCAFQISLRRQSASWDNPGSIGAATSILAVGTFGLWCAIAFAGRLIAYTQPG
jgi:hypothetical protein